MLRLGTLPILLEQWQASMQRAMPRGARTVALITSLCFGGWYIAQQARKKDQGPLLYRYAPLMLDSSNLLPSNASRMFEPDERAMHRHLHLVSKKPLTLQDVCTQFSIYSYYIKEPTLQVERPYTPLAMLSRNDACSLDMLIKRYADGELSRYLHRLHPKAPVYIRGPEVTWQLPSHASIPDEIVMMVGGTCVAASHQLLSNVLDTRDPTTIPKLTVWYAAPSMDALQAVPDMVHYMKQYPEHVSLRLWVEHLPQHSQQAALCTAAGTPIDAQIRRVKTTTWLGRLWPRRPMHELIVDGVSIPVHSGRICIEDIQTRLAHSEAWRRLVLVCGPDGFVRALAGPKARDLISQGPLGGMLRDSGYTVAEVFKM